MSSNRASSGKLAQVMKNIDPMRPGSETKLQVIAAIGKKTGSRANIIGLGILHLAKLGNVTLLAKTRHQSRA